MKRLYIGMLVLTLAVGCFAMNAFALNAAQQSRDQEAEYKNVDDWGGGGGGGGTTLSYTCPSGDAGPYSTQSACKSNCSGSCLKPDNSSAWCCHKTTTTTQKEDPQSCPATSMAFSTKAACVAGCDDLCANLGNEWCCAEPKPIREIEEDLDLGGNSLPNDMDPDFGDETDGTLVQTVRSCPAGATRSSDGCCCVY